MPSSGLSLKFCWTAKSELPSNTIGVNMGLLCSVRMGDPSASKYELVYEALFTATVIASECKVSFCEGSLSSTAISFFGWKITAILNFSGVPSGVLWAHGFVGSTPDIASLPSVIVSGEDVFILLTKVIASLTPAIALPPMVFDLSAAALDNGSTVISLSPLSFSIHSICNALLALACSRPYFRIDENLFSSIRFFKSVYTKIYFDRDENFWTFIHI